MNLSQIGEDTTISELMNVPELSNISGYLFTHPDKQKLNSKISDYGDRRCRIIESLQYAADRAVIMPLYNSAEEGGDPFKREAALIRYKASGQSREPFVIIIPGGGYNREWVLVEGHPLALEINKAGYDAYILIYRCGYFGCLVDALADIGRGLELIKKDRYPKPFLYAVTGASAGGHLASMWGIREKGYGLYGFPSPSALFLSYPGTSTIAFFEEAERLEREGNARKAEEILVYIKRMVGSVYTRRDVQDTDVPSQIRDDFPPSFLIHCKDDKTVPFKNTLELDLAMSSHGIRHITRIVEHGGHSFGLGIGTDAEGWLHQALEFWTDIQNSMTE